MLRVMAMLSLVGLVSLPCLAQSDASSSEKKAEGAPKTFYRLNFVVQEVEGQRVINSRAYSIIVRDMQQSSSSIRAGEKVPFSSTSGANTEWQQIYVGVDIDCRGLEVTGERVSVHLKADVSSVMDGQGESVQAAARPIIRNNQWESNVMLPVKQPSIIFSSDDPASKRTMRLELTVSPIRP